MKFGAVPVAEAVGTYLAHSVQLSAGRLRKGKLLGPDDINQLVAAGLDMITVARLGADDLHEDVAAAAVAQALVGPGSTEGAQGDVALTQATTGRVNVVAQRAGLARINVDCVNAANAVDPMITVATVPPLQRMAAGGLIATIKIISYGVSQTSVNAVTALSASVAGGGGLGLLRPQVRCVGLIETEIGRAPGTKGQAALRSRLDRLDVGFAGRVIVPHQVAALSDALCHSTAEVICILTASATSDAHDVGPEALRAAGGTVTHFGMPVDPGNLLFLGRLGKQTVIGLPGCARSVALNGADWVLERVLCGLDVTSADIAALGVGGLLKEIPTRGRPRQGSPG